MIEFNIVETLTFEKEFNKIVPKHLKKDLSRRIGNLTHNPYGQGKPLGRPDIRELKAHKFRIYYAIFEKKIIVLLVGVSDKKLQNSYIKRIKTEFNELKSLITSYINEKGN